MAGVYIHIPYCRQACSYCNFHFSVSWKTRNDFIDAVCKEIELHRNFFENLCGKPGKSGKPSLKTVYFGGGTPSVLSVAELVKIYYKLGQYFCLDGVEEITLEANPDDLSYEYLLALRQTPVNRLSIGIQSFQSADLAYMNRVHSPAQAFQSIKNAQKAGFYNISVDMIYGTPSLQEHQWRENLSYIIDAGIPHISAYALTVEEKTPLAFYIRKGRQTPVSEDSTARHFEVMLETLNAHGYLHYEISNFALPGHLSKHNLSYWQSLPYLGLGPSAHSFKKNHRFWNIANTSTYIESLNKGVLPQGGEALSESQVLNEYVMTSLRTMWGCNLDVIAARWGNNRVDAIRKTAQKFIDQGLLMDHQGHLVLTDKGKLFADGIAADLFH